MADTVGRRPYVTGGTRGIKEDSPFEFAHVPGSLRWYSACVIISLEMRAAVRCKSCSVLTPLPGIRNVMSCRNCAEEIDFAKRAKDGREGGLRYPFGAYYDAVAEAAFLIQEGDACRDARDSQGTPVELSRHLPRCASCDAALPMPEQSATEVKCPGCADAIPVRWPDAETKNWDPRIHCVIGDGKGRGDAGREVRGEGTRIACGQCGAPLAEPDSKDRRRSRTCGHCGGLNYLSDAALLALFPKPEQHRCHLVYDLDSREELKLYDWMKAHKKGYWLKPDQEKALDEWHARAQTEARSLILKAIADGHASASELHGFAVDPNLTDAEAATIDARLDDDARIRAGANAAPSLARRWVTAPSVEIRKIVAAHQRTDANTLQTLSRDPEAQVRAVVAARTDAPKELLAALRKDPDSSVSDAVKANSSYAPGFFEKLFG